MYANANESLPSTDNIARNFNHVPPEQVPKGVECLYTALLKLYPTQRNPLQVVSSQKYWLGGPDPLDYISMYSNPGSYEHRIPPHWHYVTMGLSDLHGDGRVHPPPKGTSHILINNTLNSTFTFVHISRIFTSQWFRV